VCAARGADLRAAGPSIGQSVAQANALAAPDSRALIQYCITCHSERRKTGGLSLEMLDPASAAEHGDIWEKVVRKMRVGMMPPAGMPRPDAQTTAHVVSSLQAALDREAAAKPNVGRPMIHRMNRAEYAFAIRDLLDLDIDPVPLLPPDESGYGFDNVADLLGTSPVLLERYLNAAGRISARDRRSGNGARKSDIFIRQDEFRTEISTGVDRYLAVVRRRWSAVDGEHVITAKPFQRTCANVRPELPSEFEIAGR
jgi:cytochrome c551/c552